MAIPISLFEYLDGHGIDYELIPHRKTSCSSQTADVTNIPDGCLAKAVLVKRKKGYLLAIVPASRRLALTDLGNWLKQPVRLASEKEVADLFRDCEVGAIPPVGSIYGLRTVVDKRLLERKHIYFEGGDHKTLVHVDHSEFKKLMEKVPKHAISKQWYVPPVQTEGPDRSQYNFWL